MAATAGSEALAEARSLRERRLALAERIQDVAEEEIAAVARVLDALGPTDRAEAARVAQTLVGLSRVLREVTALIKPDFETLPDEADDDAVPIDLDGLRRELAWRLNQVIESRSAGKSGDAADGASNV
jgi:hypothetical protein